MAYRKISNKEYEIQVNGRTQTVFVPLGKTELLFKEFISAGGLIDPASGEVQNDIISMVNSFRSVGNILLTDYDDTGKVVKEGSCFDMDNDEVIDLFLLACEVIRNFIKGLARMKEMALTLSQESASAESQRTTSKDSQ